MNKTEEQALTAITAARTFLDDPARWIKGSYQSFDEHGNKARCLEGAICHEVYIRGHTTPEDSQVIKTACQWVTTKTNSISVTGWNDRPKTTHPDVIRALDEIIAEQLARPVD